MFKNAATRLAHSSTLPVLGNKELKPLQDLIMAEKTVLVSLQRLSSDLGKASDTLKTWASGQGEELEDILGASSKLLNQFSKALYQYSSYQYAMREHMKAVRDREEALEELKRRRRALLTRSETINRKVHKLDTPNRSSKAKNLVDQIELANRTREQVDEINEEITNEEAALGDFKRRKARAWMEIKFGALLECCEKGSVVCDFGKLVINEISDKTSQPGLPRLPYTRQSKIQSLLQTALQHGEAVAFTSFSLESNPKEFVSRANSVSPMYEDNHEQTTVHPHFLNHSAMSSSPLSLNTTPSSDNIADNNHSSDHPVRVTSLDVATEDVSQQQDAAVTLNTAINNGELPLSNDRSVTSQLPIAETQQATPTPTITPPITMTSPLLSSGDVIPSLPSSDETNESASRSMGRNMPAISTTGGRGGRFAAFPVRRRILAEADISTAQSTYDPIHIFEAPTANLSAVRTNSAIYIGADTNVGVPVKEGKIAALDAEKEDKESRSSDSSSAHTLMQTDALIADQPSPSVRSDHGPVSLDSEAQISEDITELDIPSTPRPLLPSPRFSSHFTTKAYFEVLSQGQAEEPPPPLPLLPASIIPNKVDVNAPTSFASPTVERGDEGEEVQESTLINEAHSLESSTPYLSLSWPSESPVPSAPPEFSPPVNLDPPPDAEPESVSISSLQAQHLPEIPAPVPFVPNRVRFLSNPVEIPPMRPRDSWDSLFTEDDELPLDGLGLTAHAPFETHTSDDGRSLAQSFKDVSESQIKNVSSSGHNILDLLNATTAKASLVLAKLESNSPSISPSHSPSPSLGSNPSDTTGSLRSAYSPSSPPPKQGLLRSHTLGERIGLASLSPATAKSSSVEDVSTPRAAPNLTSPAEIGRKGNMPTQKKSLPSSPYPQRRVARSPSLSRLASANAKGTSSTSLSRSSSANATVPIS
ncbi:hypothetical protein F5050DRAFT_1811698 [Lentinula boryana]|uniref:Eisosome component PIL1-domain-containing protein n=1 Tax=Lentinula boryana TaxID=40481 RepID=A0ABQ8Q0T5_9AGAR|nr:hypothetical protein F5050DRAFT_1811698 [Lentinula boryana]